MPQFHPNNSMSLPSTCTPVSAPSTSQQEWKSMSNDDEDCVSFLMTLKYRSVTPTLLEDHNSNSSASSSSSAMPFMRSQLPSSTSEHNDNSQSTRRDTNPNPTSSTNSISNNNRANAFSSRSSSPSFPESFPVATKDDAYYLSDSQCLIRSQCLEFFKVKEENEMDCLYSTGSPGRYPRGGSSASAPRRGNGRGGVSVGQVGLRCQFCREVVPSARASQSTSFPTQLSGIYSAAVMFQCRHFQQCHMIPDEIRNKLAQAQSSVGPSSSNNNSNAPSSPHSIQQYWIDSAKSLGLRDTPNGIRCSFPEMERPVMHLENAYSNHSSQHQQQQQQQQQQGYEYTSQQQLECSESEVPSHLDRKPLSSSPSNSPSHQSSVPICREVSPDNSTDQQQEQQVKVSPGELEYLMGKTSLVSTHDKDLVPDYLFLAMAQMKPCRLSEADRIGCYKGRDIGFLGMCCKHCGGQPGFGKYFPATVRSLAQTTTSQTIVKHIGQKCRLIPEKLRTAINTLQEEQAAKDKIAKDTKASTGFEARPRYGSRKVFFQRIWSRLHDAEYEDSSCHDVPQGCAEEAVAESSLNNSANSSSSSSNVQSAERHSIPRSQLVSPVNQPPSSSSSSPSYDNSSSSSSDEHQNSHHQEEQQQHPNYSTTRRQQRNHGKRGRIVSYEEQQPVENSHYSVQPSFHYKKRRLVSS